MAVLFDVCVVEGAKAFRLYCCIAIFCCWLFSSLLYYNDYVSCSVTIWACVPKGGKEESGDTPLPGREASPPAPPKHLSVKGSPPGAWPLRTLLIGYFLI